MIPYIVYLDVWKTHWEINPTHLRAFYLVKWLRVQGHGACRDIPFKWRISYCIWHLLQAKEVQCIVYLWALEATYLSFGCVILAHLLNDLKSCWYFFIILFYFSTFYCCSSTLVSIFPQLLPPTQPSPLLILDPTPYWCCPCVLYTCSWQPFPLSLSITLPSPLWLLSVCS